MQVQREAASSHHAQRNLCYRLWVMNITIIYTFFVHTEMSLKDIFVHPSAFSCHRLSVFCAQAYSSLTIHHRLQTLSSENVNEQNSGDLLVFLVVL